MNGGHEMASAWGNSWGDSWGDAFGELARLRARMIRGNDPTGMDDWTASYFI